MEIRLGAEALGTDGKLGQVRGFIIDPESQQAEQMTISHLLGEERAVSLLRVTRTEADRIYLDLDKHTFDALEKFNSVAYLAPGRERLELPNWTQEGDSSVNPDLLGGMGQAPFTDDMAKQFDDPASQAVTPPDQREPVISRDTDVLDVHDVKVGRVATFAVDQVTGQATQLTIRQGHVLGHERPVPLDWIQAFTPLGITLKVEQGQLKA